VPTYQVCFQVDRTFEYPACCDLRPPEPRLIFAPVRRFHAHPVKESGLKSPAYANRHFFIEPCVTCLVAGYLIVRPRFPVVSLSELEYIALTSLGPTLAAATKAIEAVLRPERVYCALFSEETRSIHFHLFPRTICLWSQYAALPREDREISGPRLLDWARRTFHSHAPDAYRETVHAIFRELEITPDLSL